MNFKLLLGCWMVWFSLNASASVSIVRLNPPLSIAAGEVEGTELGLGKLSVDFNLDGIADVRLVYGSSGITAFLNSSNRVVAKGSVAAVPFGTLIGSNLPPSLSAYRWDSGTIVPTNSELRQFGERQRFVLTTTTAPRSPGSPVQVATGAPVTQPVLASGDVVGKEGAIAVEFYLNGQPHYAYVHVDFRSALGTGGKILGWAWETQPGVPITANRLSSGQ